MYDVIHRHYATYRIPGARFLLIRGLQLCFRFLDQQGQRGLGINSQNNGSLTGPRDQGHMSKSMTKPIQGIQ